MKMGNLVVAAFCIPWLWSCGQESQPKSISIEPNVRIEEQAPPPMVQRQMPEQKSIKSRVDSKLNTWCDEEVANLEDQRSDVSGLAGKYLDLKIKRMKRKCLTK